MRRSAANVKRQTTNFTSPKQPLNYAIVVKSYLVNQRLTSQTLRKFKKALTHIWNCGHWRGITFETSRNGWKALLLTWMGSNYQGIYLMLAKNWSSCKEAPSEMQSIQAKSVMTYETYTKSSAPTYQSSQPSRTPISRSVTSKSSRRSETQSLKLNMTSPKVCLIS